MYSQDGVYANMDSGDVDAFAGLTPGQWKAWSTVIPAGSTAHVGLTFELSGAGQVYIDDLQIVALKRRKLLVKDEIARLQLDTLVH